MSHRRMPMTLLPVSLPWEMLALAALLMLVTACGSQPQDSAGASATTAAGPTALPSGPCDRDHRDHAIAIAHAALRKRLGQGSITSPHAEFESIYLTPQQPGQRAPDISVGWMVSFLAGGHAPWSDGDANAVNITPAQAPHSHEQVTQDGRTELAMAVPSPAAASAAGDASSAADTPPVLPPPPIEPGHLGNGSLQPELNQQAILPPGAIVGTSIRQMVEFVHVDGRVTDL
jgi:hypothetical protein